jgi:very-short-patch-repair endonuclease
VPARGSIIRGVQSETVLSGKFAAAPPSVDEVIAAFARVQHGLVTLIQLLEAGLTESAISKRVARGALHRVHRTVYSVGHAALSREAKMLAAVLAAGPGALLSHLSAAELRQISRFRAYQLANVMHEAAFRDLFSDLATRDAIERANGRHKLWVVEKALALNATGSAGTKSGHEDALLVLLESTALPEPRVNTELLGFEPDCHWPDRKLVVEVDGIGHGRQRTRRQDAHEDRVLRAAGYTVLRFTDEDIQLRPERVIRALGAWAGP